MMVEMPVLDNALSAVAGLFALLVWRMLRIALRAPGDYTAFLAAGLCLGIAVQALVIAGGILGLLPLAGVVTPFLSYGRSAMLSNFAAVAVCCAIAKRPGPIRQPFVIPVGVLRRTLATAGALIVAWAAVVQVVRADAVAARGHLRGYRPHIVQRRDVPPKRNAGTLGPANQPDKAAHRGAVVAVSHDRAFLQAVVDHVLHLEAGTTQAYTADYEGFIRQRTERRLTQQRAFEKQQRTIAGEAEYIARNIAGQNSRQAKGRRKRLERLPRLSAPLGEEGTMALRLDVAERGGGLPKHLRLLRFHQ